MSSPSLKANELMVYEEVVALREEVAALRERADDQGLRLAALRTQVTPTARRGAAPDEPPVQPPMQRPLDYWAEHVPDFGDDLSEAEIQRHLARPVRQAKPPTAEELRASTRAKRTTYQWSLRDIPGAIFMLMVAILMITFLFAVAAVFQVLFF